MLKQTLGVLLQSSRLKRLVVVSADYGIKKIIDDARIAFILESSEQGVNSAVSLGDRYSQKEGADASIVIPIDLPLLRPDDVDEVIDLGGRMTIGMVMCPSLRRDGTNALLRKPPLAMPTRYDNNSYTEHLIVAQSLGIESRIHVSQGFMQDLDTPEDLMALVGINAKPNPIVSFLKPKVKLVRE